ncbi:MAG: glycosyltransferase [Sciscionella sp.]
MARIVLISASVGAGHDGVARQLATGLAAAGHQVDCYDFLALLPRRLGTRLRAAYRRQLAAAPRSWGWLLRALAPRWTRAALAVVLCWLVGSALRLAVAADADAVVSTYPLVGQVVARWRRSGKCAAPLVTYLTDPSVHPLWIAEGTDLYLTPYAATATHARCRGAESVMVVAAAVRPEFRPAHDMAERAAARARFGLPATGRLAVVLSGSWGVGAVEQAARDIAASGAATPVVVCGENTALRQRLHDLASGHVLGWVADMPTLLRACDVMVGCSGGLSVAEAHATGLPVVAYRCLPGHGRANAAVLHAAGLAHWVRDSAGLPSALHAAVGNGRTVLPALVTDPVGVITFVATGSNRAHPLPEVHIASAGLWPPVPISAGANAARQIVNHPRR